MPVASESFSISIVPAGSEITVGPGETLAIDSYVEFSTLRVDTGGTLILNPGADLVVKDIAPQLPDQSDIGILVMGMVIANGIIVAPDSANLVRDIVIRSKNPSGNRGHFMVHDGGFIDLVGVEIRDMGRTTIDPFDDAANHIGRYALHLHLLGDNDSRIEGCSIHDTVIDSPFRYGITIHGTNNVEVWDNLISNKGGAGIFFENGTEVNNSIYGNVVEDIFGTTGAWDSPNPPQRPDTRGTPFMPNVGAFAGYGIAMTGPGNAIRNNVFRRCKVGCIYYQFFSPTRNNAVNEFANNLADQCYNGMEAWYLGGFWYEQASRSILSNFRATNIINYGVFSYPQNQVTYDGFDVPSIYMADYEQKGFILQNSTVSGWVYPATICHGELLIDNCNLGSIDCVTPWYNNDARQIPPRTIRVRDSVVGQIRKGDSLAGGNRNYIVRDRLLVENHNQDLGDNFEVYALEQEPDHLLPQSQGFVVGSPDSGKTNQQNWDEYGIAWSGKVTPLSAVTRTGVEGKVVSL